MGTSCSEMSRHKRYKNKQKNHERTSPKENKIQQPFIDKYDEETYSYPREYNYIKKALEIHNDIRKKHMCEKLILNKELCELAQKYADKCSNSGNILFCTDLFKDDIIGQNIYILDKKKFDVNEICYEWYNEKNYYDFNSNKYRKDTGHFTQLVWKSTKYVGFGCSNNSQGKIYFVANYYPAGNTFNEFKENVSEAIN